MNNMSEYIKSSELCRRCKYSTKGAICEPISRCDGCKQDDGGACRCNSVKTGEPCPYFEHAFGVWISVQDRLPETDEKCIFVERGKGGVFIGYYAYTGQKGAVKFENRNGRYKVMYTATHWMPLPEPPEDTP